MVMGDDAVGAGGRVRRRVGPRGAMGAAGCWAKWIAGLGRARPVLCADDGGAVSSDRRTARGAAGAPLFGPILFPISRTIGIDPHHYGIVIVVAMGIAFFLPPVGVGLSIAASIGRVDIDAVSRSYWPYLVALLVGLVLIAAFPSITLVLPRLWGYRG